MQCERYLGGYFRAITNAMGQNMQRDLDTLGLTPTQNMFLHHLWYRQEKLGLPTYAKDLEDYFDIKHSTVSGILQRMEAAGYVTLQPSPTDRRCKRIGLTEKAMNAVADAIKKIEATEAALVRGMTEAEATELRRLLQLAANNLGVCAPHQTSSQPKEVPKL